MNSEIRNLIGNFKGKSFEDFLKYFYLNFQKEVNNRKGKDKDKYIRMRDNILKFIISNEKMISSEINKKK
jgi:hypothetical protein